MTFDLIFDRSISITALFFTQITQNHSYNPQGLGKGAPDSTLHFDSYVKVLCRGRAYCHQPCKNPDYVTAI